MSDVRVVFPTTNRGRHSPQQQAKYDRDKLAWCEAIKQIAAELEFRVGTRGWCYLQEEHGLAKSDFAKAEQLMTDCRKAGLLPLDICKEDESRIPTGLDDVGDDCHVEDPHAWAQECIQQAHTWASEAFDDAREQCQKYEPIAWTEGLEYAVFVAVEKIDLHSLFEETCRRLRVPIANLKGWGDLHGRATMMRYFKTAEEEGRTPVLLYCGDHDPGGLWISSKLPTMIGELSGAVGWRPDNLIIERFGLNYDFIQKHNLSWIENLETSSGGNLADPSHKDHYKDYVQDYLRQFGPRKVEANALVTRPQPGRALIKRTIEKYIPSDWAEQHALRSKGPKQDALDTFDSLRTAQERPA